MKTFFKISSAVLFLIVGCNSSNKETQIDPVAYQQEMDQWHQK